MAYTLEQKLGRLRNRRYDPSVFDTLPQMRESYQKRSSNEATLYALGSMQEVEPRSTEISLEEAQKVEDNLRSGLGSVSLYPDFKLQGSVAANVHIRGVSDVDLLCVEGIYLKVAPCTNSLKTYSDYSGRGSIVDDILHLRNESIKVLNRRFWAATVDTSHDKSIALSDGAFRRKVDLVPSSWYDSELFQQTLDETYRGIDIANKSTRRLIRNYPFLYISRLNAVDGNTLGGAKMGIRLIKNLKNDSDIDIELSSYDIGSLIYHCPPSYISFYATNDLSILAGVDRWFSELAQNEVMARELDTPDGTRKILDTRDKWLAVGQMSIELKSLTQAIASEMGQAWKLHGYPHSMLLDQLRKFEIPRVA
ncbi:MAG: hypothetical protein NXH70_16400 [Hyphomonas sp.]|nr:hypothetical protein [Hyphomonas sp.]